MSLPARLLSRCLLTTASSCHTSGSFTACNTLQAATFHTGQKIVNNSIINDVSAFSNRIPYGTGRRTNIRDRCQVTGCRQLTSTPVAAKDVTQDSHNKSLITSASHLEDKRLTQVEWSDGSSVYPWLWLRDNCQCTACFHPVSLSRTFFLENLDLNLRPIKTEVTRSGTCLEVEWSDGHKTQHDAQWLHERAFQPTQRAVRQLVHKLPEKEWPEELPTVQWAGLMKDDVALLQWLRLLETYGIVMVTGAPCETGHVTRLAERVAFVKRTHYGKDFSVIAKPSPSNVAYSSSALALHLDLPYYNYKPGVQLIHCVHQYEGEGGDSQVSDAARVAEQLREERPELFRLLSETPVDWVDHANEDDQQYFKTLKMPIICVKDDGRTIHRINFSQPQRDSYFSECAVDSVGQWYEALKTFHDMLYSPRNCRTFKMTSGTLMTLDNLRVTHGRTGYPSTGDVRRHIDGCYIDWDEVRSRRRVLEIQQREK